MLFCESEICYFSVSSLLYVVFPVATGLHGSLNDAQRDKVAVKFQYFVETKNYLNLSLLGVMYSPFLKMIRAVIFDFGNVVCLFDHRIFLGRVSRRTRHPIGRLEKLLFRGSGLVPRFESGRISQRQFAAGLRRLFGLSASDAWLRRAYTDKFTPIRPTQALIRRLKPRYKLGLLSNTNPWDYGDEIRHLPVFPLFDAVTLSFKVRTPKPKAAIYRDMLRKLRLPAAACVFIDDRKAYADAARRLGFHAVWYRSPRQLEAGLKRIGVKW